jgi:protein tyrosine/serine phosphatase
MLYRFSLLLFSLPLVLPISSTEISTPDSPAVRPPYAKTLHVLGISNVGKLNEFLYRGSQPNDEGLRQLKKLGINLIVDLRGERQGLVKSENKKAEVLGMRVVNIRASGWSPPKDEEIVEFLSLTQRRPKEKIFAHCWLGDDRTGVFLATYRMAFDQWTPDEAIDEMDHFHFKGFWHPAMKKYVRDFPAHFAKLPAFADLRKQAASLRH